MLAGNQSFINLLAALNRATETERYRPTCYKINYFHIKLAERIYNFM